MSEWTFPQAINAAIADAMDEDPRVVLMGEDVGENGGLVCGTRGLSVLGGACRGVAAATCV